MPNVTQIEVPGGWAAAETVVANKKKQTPKTKAATSSVTKEEKRDEGMMTVEQSHSMSYIASTKGYTIGRIVKPTSKKNKDGERLWADAIHTITALTDDVAEMTRTNDDGSKVTTTVRLQDLMSFKFAELPREAERLPIVESAMPQNQAHWHRDEVRWQIALSVRKLSLELQLAPDALEAWKLSGIVWKAGRAFKKGELQLAPCSTRVPSYAIGDKKVNANFIDLGLTVEGEQFYLAPPIVLRGTACCARIATLMFLKCVCARSVLSNSCCVLLCCCICFFVLPAPQHSMENFVVPYWPIISKQGSPDGNMVKKMVTFTITVSPGKTESVKVPILVNNLPLQAKDQLSLFEAAAPETAEPPEQPRADEPAKRRRVAAKAAAK